MNSTYIMIIGRCVVGVFIYLSLGCAFNPDRHGGKIADYASVVDTQETYRNGLADIFESLADKEIVNDIRYEGLLTVREAVYSTISWGKIEANGKMFSLTNGNTGGCWIFIFDKDNPVLLKPDNTLTTGIQNGMVSVVVRPNRISRRWAGIFLTHELSHAFERMYKTDIKEEESEYFAHVLEKMAYNYITEGKLDIVLRDVMNDAGIITYSDFEKLLNSSEEAVDNLMRKIEVALSEEKPLSGAEGEMRYGFYLMSLSLRIGETTRVSRSDRVKNMNELLKKYSMYPVRNS